MYRISDKSPGARPADGAVDAVVLAGGINRVQLYPGYDPDLKAVL